MNPYNSQPFTPRIGERREPGLVLLLSIVTCGIYYLWYIAKVSGEMLDFDGEPDTPPVQEVLFSVLSCGLYTIYWDYKTAKKIARMQAKVGLIPIDNSLLFMVLNFVGLGVVPSLIEQGHMNEIWLRAQQNAANQYPSA